MKATYLVSSKHKRYGTLKLIVKRRDGSVKYVREQTVDSFTHFLWTLIRMFLNQSQNASFIDIEGVSRLTHNGATANSSHWATAGSVEQDIGIVVGTGSSPVLVTNYQLSSIIPHGSGTNEMERSASEPLLSDLGYTLTRVFENISGDTINISEAGIIATVFTGLDPGPQYLVLLCRDLVDPVVPVEDGESATVIYDLFFGTGTRNIAAIWRQLSKAPNNSPTHGDRQVTFWRATGAQVTEALRTELRVDGSAAGARGIFAGTDDTDPEVNEVDLGGLIPQGAGEGQLLYGSSIITEVVFTNNNERVEFDVQRVIMNESGGDVTIREIGLFSNSLASDMSTRVMLDRYVLPTPLTLAHGEARVARWLFRYAV